MKFKRNIIILISSIFVFFILRYLNNSIVNVKKYTDVYILNKDVEKGTKLDESYLKKASLKKETAQELQTFTNLNSLCNYVSISNMSKGQILTNEVLQNEEEYLVNDKNLELISIKVANSYDFSSYQISRDSVVNLYYTGKTEFTEEVLKNINNYQIISSGDNGYISLKLLENIKVKNTYDKYGNAVLSSSKKGEDVLIDTIVIEISNNMASVINNLKKYGDFSVTLIK